MGERPDSRIVVDMRDISVVFPGVRALDHVDVQLRSGEVHALMGENGAGKSTLIKALTGVNALATGEITLDGQPFAASGPGHAQAAGISTVYQEVNLCPNMTVAENVMLGHEVRRGPFINWKATRERAREALRQMDIDIDPRSQLSSHTIAIQQLCSIARALVTDAKVLILDEPTSSLDRDEVKRLFSVVRSLRDSGVAILFVSHFLDQVYEISDRMTVLRNGRRIGEYLTADLARSDLISAMVGHAVESLADIESKAQAIAEEEDSATVVLHANQVGRGRSVAPFDLTIREGEIIGFAGLLGSGRSEAARLIAGADRNDSGHIQIGDKAVVLKTPAAALAHGIAYSTEDRKKEGIIGDLTIRENIALALQSYRGVFHPIPRHELDGIVNELMDALNIHPRNPSALIKNLSGGNQQKVLLARWLAMNPRLLILDEPTRGIDVGAKAEIQKLVTQLASDKMSVIFISSELDEVLRLSQTLCIMRDREMIATWTNSPDITQGSVLAAIAQAHNEDTVQSAAERSQG
ncbi:MAG: sugar ABC transporter ATP-binding protein [Actinomycetaceae bacterium]|nr:sugar ABC transporter ATP-binding protein [Actinomycetaceae bacterium]